MVLTSAIGGVAWPQRAQLLVLGSARQRADLAVRPPAAAPVAAALGLGDSVAVGGGLLAHDLENLGEAETLTVIWGGNCISYLT